MILHFYITFLKLTMIKNKQKYFFFVILGFMPSNFLYIQPQIQRSWDTL